MPQPVPIEVLPLFQVLDKLLLELLRSLSPTDWQRPTLARQWTVKDIAAHLLDGNLRTLSMLRDGHYGPGPGEINTYEQLLAFLNQLNADWVSAARRLSPSVLIEWLARSGQEYTAFLHTLQPFEPAAFAVAWAGERESANWFHVARDYTEKWHHQQQIREAVGQTAPLLTTELFKPFIETLMRGLPHAYRHVMAPVGTMVQVRVPGPGGEWQLVKQPDTWALQPVQATISPTAEVSLPPEIAWKLFTKGLSPGEARAHASLGGEVRLAEAALHLLAVMA